MDVHAIVGRGLTIKEGIEPYEDPVERIIFMFYLETLW